MGVTGVAHLVEDTPIVCEEIYTIMRTEYDSVLLQFDLATSTMYGNGTVGNFLTKLSQMIRGANFLSDTGQEWLPKADGILSPSVVDRQRLFHSQQALPPL
ncbi:unnamed protein product [Taenia asiatica]|uniref:Ras-GAP domain-containing protein n=1 Tax=Taenia asiatica TaxID=60517 RepID=A0A158R7R0_TAEAS|nr:unnamed protein product [Taenia asiatica]